MSTILRLKIAKSRPVRRGHDYYWKVIRDLTEIHSRDVFTISDILEKCSEVTSSDVRLFLRLLEKSDIVKKIDPDKPGAACENSVDHSPAGGWHCDNHCISLTFLCQRVDS